MRITGKANRGNRLTTTWFVAAVATCISAGLTGCTDGEAPVTQPSAMSATAGPNLTNRTIPNPEPSLAGTRLDDSFGNTDFYTTGAGDTLATIAGVFKLSDAKIIEFNQLEAGVPLRPGTKLRLIPADGPMTGARGAASLDSNGIPTSYKIEPEDTLAGILYRFGLTDKQLAEANKVPYVNEQGNTYFIREGHAIQLQKNPVDARAGRGAIVNNSFGQAISYTTVDGDSFDSLGYQFRSTTEQILLYNPELSGTNSIPSGTKVRLIPGSLKIRNAMGEFTVDSQGVPLTYTTAPGDTERQVSFRFAITDLRAANRPSRGTGGAWYAFIDLPNGELTPGQTISLSLVNPINKPEA